MIIKKEVEIGGKIFSIETGRYARQANGAVMVRYGDTMVLVTAVATSEAVEGLSIEQLEALVADAARFNKVAGVTGVLLYDGARFVQYFEGPEDGVASVYERVLQATSHTGVVELARGRVSTRQFPYWSMHRLPADQLLVGKLARADWSRFKKSEPEEIAGSLWGIDVLAAAVAPYVQAA